MGDLLQHISLSFDAGLGPSWFQRAGELKPYDQNYFTTYLGGGVETRPAWSFLGLVSPKWVSMTVFADLNFAYTGGDEQNLGSHRFQLLARVGPRFRIIERIVVDACAGIGWGLDYLDFGKGFPLEGQHIFAGQMQATFGLEFCFNRDFCLHPYGGFAYEAGSHTPAYAHMMWMFGLRVGGDPKESVPAEAEPPTAESLPPLAPREVVRVVEKVVPESGGVADLPRAIHFANDNPDLPLQPQWFKAVGPGLFECFANPELDLVIRTLNAWGARIANRQRTGIRFLLRVKGYANDTGDLDRNVRLAGARAQAVLDYLSGAAGTGSRLRLVDPHVYPQRRDELRRRSGVDLDRYSARRTCGAQDSTGLRSLSLQPLIDAGIVVLSNGNQRDPRAAREDIIQDFGSRINPEDPRFRMARLQLLVEKDGVALDAQASEDFVRGLGGR